MHDVSCYCPILASFYLNLLSWRHHVNFMDMTPYGESFICKLKFLSGLFPNNNNITTQKNETSNKGILCSFHGIYDTRF